MKKEKKYNYKIQIKTIKINGLYLVKETMKSYH